jgi:hypothetical protein
METLASKCSSNKPDVYGFGVESRATRILTYDGPIINDQTFGPLENNAAHTTGMGRGDKNTCSALGLISAHRPA